MSERTRLFNLTVQVKQEAVLNMSNLRVRICPFVLLPSGACDRRVPLLYEEEQDSTMAGASGTLTLPIPSEE